MIINWNDLFIFVILLLISMTIAIFISKSWWYKQWKSKLNQPILTQLNVKHEKEMNQILKILPTLTAEEKEHVLATLFGSTIKFLKIVTPSGHSHLEAVGTYGGFEDSGEDYDPNSGLG